MNKYQSYLIAIFSFLLMLSCKTEKKNTELKTGFWRGEINVQENQLPFIFEVLKGDDDYKINLHDGSNIIELDEVSVINDSIFFTMHIFDIDVKAKINKNSLEGTYTKNYAEDYVLPFKATFNLKNRVEQKSTTNNFDGKWSMKLKNKDGTEDDAVGVFETKNNQFQGTILTPTGDYRFLEGYAEDDNFTLYAFDGNHAFVFKGEKNTNDVVNGTFWSGKTFNQSFTAIKNENASLPDPNKLTYLKEGYDKIEFSFPNLEGNLVSLNDPKYKDRVVILQIFGTWCPNCMDETKFYTKWYDKNKSQGVEIIGLAYEVKDDFEYAKKRVQKMIDKYDINYDYLIAGTSNKKDAAKTLPMLNHIMSFPTSIIIDKKGKVRSIHTGFSGPATGDYYLHYVEEFNALMDTLLSE